MAINFNLQEQYLHGRKKYFARVRIKNFVNKNEFIDRMLEYGSSITKADVLAVITVFEETVRRICLEGNKINLDNFIQFTPAIAGIFESNNGKYDKTINYTRVTAQVSKVFNKKFNEDAKVEKTVKDEVAPEIHSVKNINTSAINKDYSVRNIISVKGRNLKILNKDNEYLRFYNEKNRDHFNKILKFQRNTDKELVFLMPYTGFDKGYFEIASYMSSKSLRTGRSIILYNTG